MKQLQKNLVLLFAASHLCIIGAGCAGGGIRAHGGSIIHDTPSARHEVQQPENPKDGAKQDVQTHDEISVPIPAGATVSIPSVVTTSTGAIETNTVTFAVPSNAPPVEFHRVHDEKSSAKVGASQLDVVGEIAAKLKSTWWWSIAGFIMFAGGIFAALYPPATTIFGGPFPGIGIAGAGLVIAVLPVLLVGHETLIIVGAVVAAGIALALWFAHNHGGVVAELKQLKSEIIK